MDNKNSYALKITTGAMILAIFAILLLINRQTGAFFEEFFIYLLPGYLTPQNSERRMAPVFLRQIEISYYS